MILLEKEVRDQGHQDEFEGHIHFFISVLNTAQGAAKRMCTNFTFTGSMIYLRNLEFPLPSREDFCSCEVEIKNETYIEFDSFTFQVCHTNNY